ncbi:MAG: PilZ domain-containing protein [Candidatus Omnitrophota bacterium]
MGSKSSIIYNEARNNLRIKESRNIFWRVNDGDIKGKGQIRNISTTGMLLETNSNFIPTDGCRFSFDTSLGHDNFIPQNGKLVWHRKKIFSKNKYLCGIRFVEPGEYVLTKLRFRVQKGIKKIASTRRLKRATNAILILLMISMTVYIAWEANNIYRDLNITNQRMLDNSQQQALITQSYATRLDTTQMQLTSVSEELEATKILYQESQGILGEVRVDLELTKAVLADTEQLLEQTKVDLRKTQTELVTSKSDIADMQSKLAATQSKVVVDQSSTEEMAARINSIEKSRAAAKTEFENTIALLEEKNKQLTEQMAQFQGQLILMSADKIQSTQEGQNLLERYQKEINLVKAKLSHFRQEAKQIREDALKERDRVQLALGNQGYFMREGKSVQVDLEKYNNAGLYPAQSMESVAGMSVPEPAMEVQTKPTPRKVEIDVTFVE